MQTFTEQQARSRVQALSASVRKRPYLLGIAGTPGAGKSTFTDSLGVPVLAMDAFHYANEHLDRLGIRQRKGAPDSFDVAGYASALRRLRGGESLLAPRFDRDIDEAIASAVPLDGSSSLVVTEGNYLLYDEHNWGSIRPLLDEVWFLDIDDSLRQRRLVERHRRFGRSAQDAIQWVDSVDQPNATLITLTRRNADAVVTLTEGISHDRP